MTVDLRQLFPNKAAVKIYPDDFPNSTTGKDDTNDLNTKTYQNIVLPELVDRNDGHFSDQRVAILFRPGTYKNVNLPVGYWTQVLGLGETPDLVQFQGSLGVYCLPANTDNPHVGSLDTFWRSAENFTSDTSFIYDENQKAWCIPTIVDTDNDNNNDNDESNNKSSNIKTDVTKCLIPNQDGKFPYLTPVGNLANSDPRWAYPPKEIPNFTSEKGMLWAVSQAAPIRRVHVTNNLHLSLGGNCASGGFVANTHVGGYLLMGSQQQFCVRNCDVDYKAAGGAWSMVLNGCRSQARNYVNNKSTDQGKNDQYKEDRVVWAEKDGVTKPLLTDDPTTTTKIEKPFLFIAGDKEEEQLYLGIPKVQHYVSGVNYKPLEDCEKVPIDNAKKACIFSPESCFANIQGAADRGAHIILSPGTYNWKQTLVISKTNTVVLGIGMATLQAPGDGTPCIHVSSKAHGVRISGLSLEASVISKFIYKGSTLLAWGEADNIGAGDVSNPGAIHDLYCFVGGRSPHRTVKVECMVKIYSSHVVGDNLWLWRADHVKLMPGEAPNRPELSEYHITTYGECICDIGLEVHGDHVMFHGLAVEHTYKDMVSWYGKNGKVYFYQSEMPYDIPGDKYEDVAGYRVHVGADDHLGKGFGIYSYFRDFDNVEVESAIVHHATDGSFHNSFTVWLNGHSGIKSVINGKGGVTKSPGTPVIYNGEFQGKGIFSQYFWSGLHKKLFRSS